MVFWKKLKGTLVMVVMLIVFATPCIAAEQDSVITLERAKELAKTNARVLKTTEYTKQKLELESDAAYSTYMSYNLQYSIDGYRYRINQLSKELEELDPYTNEDDIEPYLENMERILKYETIVTYLNANKPDASIVKNFRLAWRATDDAYKDMSQTVENIEKSLDLAVESLYFTLLDMQDTIDLQNKNLSNMGMQLRIERLKKELGLSNVESENMLVTQYNMFKNAINELKSNCDVLCWQLNDMMGRELDAPLQIVEEAVVPVKVFYNKDEVYEEAVKNSLEIAQKERQIENNHKDMVSEKDRNQREILKKENSIAQNELIDLEIGMKEKIKALVDQLEAGYVTWTTAVTEKEQAELSHQYNKARFDLGLIPQMQMDLSETAYLDAVYKEKKAARAWQLINHQLVLAKEGLLE
jgi:hypothetical protein